MTDDQTIDVYDSQVASYADMVQPREPDQHLGFQAFGWLTRGQILSLPMIALGVILLVIAYRGGTGQQLGTGKSKGSTK